MRTGREVADGVFTERESAFSKPPEVESEDAIIVDEVGNRGISKVNDL
jgi:hypothetical protein